MDAIWAVVLAAVAAASVFGAIRSRVPGWLLLGAACLPVAAILLKDDVRIFSYHGLMHTSLVYRILAGGLPPLDPFMAGEAVRYAWAHHAVVAGLSALFRLSPPACFALLNVAMLAGTAFFLDRTAARLDFDRPARILAVVLAVYGISAFSRGPLWHSVQLLTGIGTVTRILPVEKFAHVNSNATGILCFALYLWAAVGIWGGAASRSATSWLGLFGAVLGAALLYPLAWLPIAASAGACGLVLFSAAPGERLRKILMFAAVGIAASVLALPYLLQVQGGRTSAASFSWTESGFQALRKSLTVVLTLALAGAVCWAGRSRLAELRKTAPESVVILAGTVAVCCLLYLATHLPTHTEYKFLLTATIPAGLLSAPALACLLERKPTAAFAALWLALVPAMSHGVELVRTAFGATGRLVTHGPLLLETDPIRNELNRWIREQTPSDAVFVDSELAVPPFAHRSLFALLDRGIQPLPGGDTLHGWGLPPSMLLNGSFGHAEESIRRRYEISLRLLSRRAKTAGPEDIAELRRVAGQGPVYLIVRDPERQKLPAAGLPFEVAFEVGPTRVFRLQADPNPFAATPEADPQLK